ncbi:MAG: hypothetical protein AAF851_05660 [Myxococcota bacterium]
MSDFQTELQLDDRAFVAWVEVSGLGDRDGPWRLTHVEPDRLRALGAGEGSWRPYLAALPDLQSSQLDWLKYGVTKDSGALALAVQDFNGEVTNLLRLGAEAETLLSGTMSALATTVPLPSGFSATIGDVYWIAAEAVRVTGLPETVDRGWLGTQVVEHARGTSLYRYPNSLKNREARLYIAPMSATSDADRVLVGAFRVKGVEFSEDHNAWIIKAELSENWRKRRTPRAPTDFEITTVGRANLDEAESEENPAVTVVSSGPRFDVFPDSGGITGEPVAITRRDESEAEIVVIRAPGRFTASRVIERAHVGSKRSELAPGAYRIVKSAALGDFRTKVGADGTLTGWTPTTNVLDLILCIATSSANPNDGLAYANPMETDDLRSFASLPSGYGIGLKASEVDYSSFYRLRQGEAAGWDLSQFVLGPEPMTFEKLVDAEFLKPFGLVLTSIGGKLTCILPQLPLNGQAPTVTIGQDQVFGRRIGPGHHLPEVDAARDLESTTSAVQFRLGRQDRQVNVTWASFGRIFDPADEFEVEANTLELPVRGAGVDDAAADVLESRALTRLWRTFRPSTRLDIAADAALWDLRPGLSARVTLQGLVNTATGARGFVNAWAECVEREEKWSAARGFFLELSLLVAPDIRLGRIAPAADVASVSGNTATVEPNQYTATDSAEDLPKEDADAFEGGDVVQLIGADGVLLASGLTQEVISAGSDQIELDGDFDGALAPGTTIITAEADEATGDQRDRYVFFGSVGTGAIGATPDPLWSYA